MTYFSDFTSQKQRHANFKGVRRDSQETKPCQVENDTETLNRGFLFPVSMGLILILTKSKTKLD